MSEPLNDNISWEIHLDIHPRSDGRFATIRIEIRKPTTRVPTYINTVSSSDLLFEHTQGELNNALRQVVNEIVQTVIKPNKHRR